MRLYTLCPEASAAQRRRYKLPLLYPGTRDTRVTLRVSQADLRALPRGKPGARATITDHKTKQRFIIESAPCGLLCHCAARIVRKVAA